jgi:hypothetical protein
MDRHEHNRDNITARGESAPRRSREQVFDSIRKALLSDGVRPRDGGWVDHSADRSAGSDPYNSGGRARIREPWSRR